MHPHGRVAFLPFASITLKGLKPKATDFEPRNEGTVNQVMGEASWRCSLLERPTIEQFGAGVSVPSIVRRSPLSRLSQEYSKHSVFL